MAVGRGDCGDFGVRGICGAGSDGDVIALDVFIIGGAYKCAIGFDGESMAPCTGSADASIGLVSWTLSFHVFFVVA